MTNKAVLISIRPKWCKLIASGKKTVEIRKTHPKIETPFKCYIYKTLPKSGDWNDRDGRVIGEFVCDEVITDEKGENALLFEQEGCVPFAAQKKYAPKKTLYGWHISNLVIYDVPKKLSDLRLYNTSAVIEDGLPMPTHEIRRPPQSWCYVEGLE